MIGRLEAPQREHLPKPLRTRAYTLVRWLHLYASMLSLMVVIFFAATGITLNHPEWMFGTAQTTHTYSGTLPQNWQRDGQVDWLQAAEALRAAHGLKGRVSDTRADDQEASISFRGPAYAADAFINRADGSYTLKVVAQGPVAVLNDLHRGRDTGRAWAWLIDLSGGFLLLVALTGFGLSFFFRKTRAAALTVALIGTAAMLLLMRLVA
ncbi:PepSY-associated TM helix domain-containing protein [Meiothermus hypogaeus]|uniref:Peptidase n=2 Tax=Meiothermus hypogaeus TaxID=884155 RepID=A0A511QYH4_9DEIN|nr:PepSY-associated TM helix domain-containing protein [Meiothermus hypogaeus]RIH80650.1 putative PepSY TM-like protein [Meiothermus hypogaeus]GEM82047.1 peptidase [Meiothermus hypogaeus NBRC 106114]GIW36358.1 MAG: peptidase [Meiothermus sp.]